MLFALIRDSDGKDVGLIPLAEKAFTSGSRGYFGQAKLQLVAIGSKNEGKEAT
jgi:hypothetical protein